MNITKKIGFLETAQTAMDQQDMFQAVRDLASNLITCAAPSGPPFDPELYTQQFGIHVVDAPCTTEGFLTTSDKFQGHLTLFDSILRVKERPALDFLGRDTPVIVVRRQSGPPTDVLRQRRRFTVAHEFAHWFLRNTVTTRLGPVEFDHDADEEMLCDLFAAELLLPTSHLARDLGKAEFKLSELMLLAKTYDVSLRTLLVKITGLSRHYSAFALYSLKENAPEVCYTTPVRQRNVFFDAQILSDVSLAFESESELRGRHTVMIKGKQTEVATEHVPFAAGRKVLSYVCTRPFETREPALAG